MTRERLILSQSSQDFRSDSLNVIQNYLNMNTKLKYSKSTNFTCVKSEKDEINYWPNADASVWMRSCENEVIVPLKGEITGHIPQWLKGTLLRNGPGSLKVGDYEFDHLFDSSALLHRFYINAGEVTYQRRFVQTDVFKKNHEAKRIVTTEFGTKAVPDPCQSIFRRVAAIFNPGKSMSDNSLISVYPLGDEFYTFAEAPVIHRINSVTLETMERINISNYVGIVNHTSHPHIVEDGRIFNVGLSVTSKGPAYNVVEFSPIDSNDGKKSMFDQAKIVATVPARWKLNPSYMHTFGITENYFIIIEQPLAIAFTTLFACQLKNEPMCTCLKWHENENTLLHVVSRANGKVTKTFIAETFFFLHIINQFETHNGNYIVLDICCYRDAKMLDCMFVDEMKNMHKNPDYSKMFRGRPLRFILPMAETHTNMEDNLIKIKTVHQGNEGNLKDWQQGDSLLHRNASAHRLPDGNIFVKPELVCDLGCETPRINYDRFLGREYRYFYAISSDVDLENPGTIIKVDAATKTKITWNHDNLYPSEPIFIPRPGGEDEDDGVIVSAAVFGKTRETDVCLLIFDAKTLRELGRATFSTPGPVPKCLHGWFSLDKD